MLNSMVNTNTTTWKLLDWLTQKFPGSSNFSTICESLSFKLYICTMQKEPSEHISIRQLQNTKDIALPRQPNLVATDVHDMAVWKRVEHVQFLSINHIHFQSESVNMWQDNSSVADNILHSSNVPMTSKWLLFSVPLAYSFEKVLIAGDILSSKKRLLSKKSDKCKFDSAINENKM